MRRKQKVFINSLLQVYACFGFFLGISLGAECSIRIDSKASTGEWSKGVVSYRDAVFTHKEKVSSEAEVYIPAQGKYQLIAYIHHNWRKSCPCVYVEAIDSAGKAYKGYYAMEHIWYLNSRAQGRWFFVSLSNPPYWELPKGVLRIKFWAQAKDNAWVDRTVPMENRISIAHFFLLPVRGENPAVFLSWMPNIESGTGGWEVCDYDPVYATNFIKTQQKGQIFHVRFDVPVSAKYSGWLSVLSESDAPLEICFKNKEKEITQAVVLKAGTSWNLVSLESVSLEKGPCEIYFRNLDHNAVMIDYFFLAPGNISELSLKQQ
jgi:hypothetical protein